ncbi:MAG: glycoside hydrolase family 3 C-terminal domain-containing protein, partial [Oscillospiraceae bacterium]|nr:glycoside hydrolase family 3 C-terminal domain-containing protein [Oscillospiraceae bacterium]
VAEKVDLVIAAVGLNCLLEGEEGDQSNAFSGGDKNSLYLPEPQMKLLETLCGLGKPLIVVSLVGSSIDLGIANEKANAIVHAWYPGAFGGRAFGRLITGKANFSGKLPVTFYKETNNIPAFTDYAMDNRTYKFFKEDPLYPFGYGLSYTKFAYSDFAAEKAEIAAGETVKVCAKVKNVGAVDGEEVVEVYIRDLEASTRVPRHKLCAFGRVKLAAGEEKTVCFELGAAAFQLIDENGDKVIEPGAFEIFIGGGQPDALTEKLTGTACVHGKVCVK